MSNESTILISVTEVITIDFFLTSGSTFLPSILLSSRHPETSSWGIIRHTLPSGGSQLASASQASALVTLLLIRLDDTQPRLSLSLRTSASPMQTGAPSQVSYGLSSSEARCQGLSVRVIGSLALTIHQAIDACNFTSV